MKIIDNIIFLTHLDSLLLGHWPLVVCLINLQRFCIHSLGYQCRNVQCHLIASLGKAAILMVHHFSRPLPGFVYSWGSDILADWMTYLWKCCCHCGSAMETGVGWMLTQIYVQVNYFAAPFAYLRCYLTQLWRHLSIRLWKDLQYFGSLCSWILSKNVVSCS